MGFTKLRIVDIIVGILQREISSRTDSTINNVMFSDFELELIYKKIQKSLKLNLDPRS